jgi:hypothetical protein
MLHRVAVELTDVSEKCSTPIIRVKRIGDVVTTLAATSNRRTLPSSYKSHTAQNPRRRYSLLFCGLYRNVILCMFVEIPLKLLLDHTISYCASECLCQSQLSEILLHPFKIFGLDIFVINERHVSKIGNNIMSAARREIRSR